MTETPKETYERIIHDREDDDVNIANPYGEAFNPTVQTEDNTGGFKPGRDEPQEDED